MASTASSWPQWPHLASTALSRPPWPCSASMTSFGLYGLVLASTALSQPPWPRSASTAMFGLYCLVLASTTLSKPQRPRLGLHGLYGHTMASKASLQPCRLSAPQRLSSHLKFNHWKKTDYISLQSESCLHFSQDIRVSEDWGAIVLPQK